MLESFASSPALRAAIPLDPAIPKLSHNRTHHRIARFAAVISSHPKMSPNRPAPSPIETRNQLSGERALGKRRAAPVSAHRLLHARIRREPCLIRIRPALDCVVKQSRAVTQFLRR